MAATGFQCDINGRTGNQVFITACIGIRYGTAFCMRFTCYFMKPFSQNLTVSYQNSSDRWIRAG